MVFGETPPSVVFGRLKMRIPLNIALVVGVLSVSTTPVDATVDLYLSSGATECHFRTNTKGLEPDSRTLGALRADGSFMEGCATSVVPAEPPPPPHITMSVAASYSHESSGALEVSWRAGADECVFDLPVGWTATPPDACDNMSQCMNGSADITVPSSAAPGPYEIRLICTRLGGPGSSASKTKTVSVTSAPTPSECVTPAGVREVAGKVTYWGEAFGDLENINLTDFAAVFGRTINFPNPLAWPNRHNQLRSPTVTKDRYIALKFAVPTQNPPAWGTMGSSPSGANPESQNGMISFSECPGDFGQAGSDLAQNCVFTGTLGGGLLAWKTAGTPMVQDYCVLTPGKTYYVNVKSTCTSPVCRYSLKNSFTQTISTAAALGIEILM